MRKAGKDHWHGEPVRYFSGIFGNKWSLMILRDMIFAGKRSFGAFLDSPEKIATNILSTRLGELVDAGVIAKVMPKRKGARAVYILTPRGRALLPVIFAIMDWAAREDPESDADASLLGALRDTPSMLKVKLMAGIDAADKAALA
ncbi:MAG: helix-turn-helix domain-containing protein [Paracoccaceae bacterium]